jgi:hypothetical protein
MRSKGEKKYCIRMGRSVMLVSPRAYTCRGKKKEKRNNTPQANSLNLGQALWTTYMET